MKTFKLFCCVAASALLLNACERDSALTDERGDLNKPLVDIESVTMTAKDFNFEKVSTRTKLIIDIETGANFYWNTNDIVGVFPNLDDATQVKFPIKDGNVEGGTNTKQANFTGSGWAVMKANTYLAYYPFTPDMNLDKKAIPVDYTGQVQNGSNNADHLASYDYMVAAPKEPESNGNISFNFEHMGCLLHMVMTVPKVGEYTSLSLYSPDVPFTTKGYIDATVENPAIEPAEWNHEFVVGLTNFETKEANEMVVIDLLIPPMNITESTEIAVKLRGPHADFNTSFVRTKPFLAGKAVQPTLGKMQGGEVVLLEPGSNFNTDIKSLANGEDYILDKKDYLIKHIVFESCTDGEEPTLEHIDVSADASPEPIYASWDPETGTVYVSSKAYKVYGNEDASNMFYNMTKLESVEFEDFSLDFTTSVIAMFRQCPSIRTIDLSALNLTTVNSMYWMFMNCSALESITWPNSTFSKNGTVDMGGMFRECRSLSNIDLSCFDGCTSVSLDGTFVACTSLKSIDLSKIDLSRCESLWEAFGQCTSLTTLDVSNLNWEGAGAFGYMFSGCSSLKSINLGDCHIINGGRIDGMFAGCSSLERLDYTRFEISADTYNGFFSGCSSLRTIDVSKIVPSSATCLLEMFSGCSSLESLDLSGWNTSNVNNTAHLLSGCSSLKRIDLSSFRTYEVELMYEMFAGCSNLKEIVWGNNFSTEKVTDMSSMFKGCSSMETIDVSGFTTSKVLTFAEMFSGCEKAQAIIGIQDFDVHYAERFAEMFNGCSSLKTLDLSGWNTSSMTDMNSMFAWCSSLESLNVSSFTTDKCGSTEMIWGGCSGDERLHDMVINLGKDFIFREGHGLLAGIPKGATFICSRACFESQKQYEQWWSQDWRNCIWIDAADGTLIYGNAFPASYEEIADAIALGCSTITLFKDINTSSTIELTGDKDLHLILNGCTITSSAAVAVKNNGTGTLTIDGGNGRIDNSSYDGPDGITVWARTGDILIQGGEYVNRSSEEATIYVGTSASTTTPVVTINGGEFMNNAEGTYKWKPEWKPIVLNVQNSKPVTSIVVYGGYFHNQNPGLGDDNLGGSFLASNAYCWNDENGIYKIDSAWN